MRPVAWSTSYLLRCPLGISIVTSYSTAVPFDGDWLRLARKCRVSQPNHEQGDFVRSVSRGLAALGVLLVAGGGYLTADVYDLVPGMFTLDRLPSQSGTPTLPAATQTASPSGTVPSPRETRSVWQPGGSA